MVEKKRSICLYCSLGCGTSFRANDGRLTAIDYDKDDVFTRGSLCPRGHYNIELINHPKRLTDPQVGNKKISWKEAISFIHEQRKKYTPDELGISISANASNEDALLVGEAAKQLGIRRVIVSGNAADNEAYDGTKWGTQISTYAKTENIGNADALLIVGDILIRSPVLSRSVNKVKYGKRGNQVIVVDPNASHTSWFATTHLRPKPGTETVLVAGILKVICEENKTCKADLDLAKASEITGIAVSQIESSAKAFDAAESGAIIFAPSDHILRNDLAEYFIRHISASSPHKDHITYYGSGNAHGVNLILDHQVKDRISSLDNIKALFSFGPVNIPASLDLLVYCGYFMPDKLPKNSIMLPLASHMERKGSVILAGEKFRNFKPIGHKVGGKTPIEVVSLMMEKKSSLSEIIKKTNDIIAKGTTKAVADLKEKLREALKITATPPYGPDNITHFGNNEQVKRFFWYRVNNNG